MSIRKNLIIFLGILCFFSGFAYAQNYGQANKQPVRKERKYYGTVVQYSDKFVVIRREVTESISERLRFRIDKNTEITGRILIGSKVAVVFKILNRNHHKRLALKIYPVQTIPKYR
jgi:hypothetical protein